MSSSQSRRAGPHTRARESRRHGSDFRGVVSDTAADAKEVTVAFSLLILADDRTLQVALMANGRERAARAQVPKKYCLGLKGVFIGPTVASVIHKYAGNFIDSGLLNDSNPPSPSIVTARATSSISTGGSSTRSSKGKTR